MIYRDHFQNYKSYAIPKAQLIIADIPYNLVLTMELHPPQKVLDEYTKLKRQYKDVHILFNAHNSNFYVSIFPLWMMKNNLFTKVVV